MFKKLIYLITFILLFVIKDIYADYDIIYSFNIEKTKIGDVIIESRGNRLKATINLELTMFADFKQEINTVLKTNFYPITENASTKFGEINGSEIIAFGSNIIILRQIKEGKTNVINYINSEPSLTIISLLNLFIKNKISDFKTCQVFNVNSFYNLKMESIKENEFIVKDINDEYAVVVQQERQRNAVIPKKIIIQKYKMLDINWDIFNLTLKEYREL